MKRLGILFLVLPILAQAQVDTIRVRQWSAIRGIDGVVFTLTSPVRWKGNDWMKAGGVVAGTAALTLLDEPIRNLFQGKRSPFFDGIQRVVNPYGKPYGAISIMSGMYLYGAIFEDEWAKDTGLMLFTALSSSTVVQTLFKNAVGRARPNEEFGNYELVPFSPATAFHSLPSGHTTVAFTVSMVMARQVRSKPLKIVFYSMASLTAVSRLYLDVHWFSDLAFGGTIAWFCADAAIKRLEANRHVPIIRKRKMAWKVYPFPGGLTLRAKL